MPGALDVVLSPVLEGVRELPEQETLRVPAEGARGGHGAALTATESRAPGSRDAGTASHSTRRQSGLSSVIKRRRFDVADRRPSSSASVGASTKRVVVSRQSSCRHSVVSLVVKRR